MRASRPYRGGRTDSFAVYRALSPLGERWLSYQYVTVPQDESISKDVSRPTFTSESCSRDLERSTFVPTVRTSHRPGKPCIRLHNAGRILLPNSTRKPSRCWPTSPSLILSCHLVAASLTKRLGTSHKCWYELGSPPSILPRCYKAAIAGRTRSATRHVLYFDLLA